MTQNASSHEDTAALKQLEQKMYRAGEQDGLLDVMLGGFLFITAAVVFTPASLFLVLGMVILPRILEQLRKRYTYSRSGYVMLRSEEPRETMRGIFTYMILVGAAMLAVLFIFFGEITGDLLYRASPLFFALMLLGAFNYLHERSGWRRLYLYAGIALVGGIVCAFSEFANPKDGLPLYLAGMGALFLLTGLAMFVTFVRTHPVVVDEPDGIK